MLCPNCQTENHESAIYCLRCGVRLSRECVRCGSPNVPTATSCAACGAEIAVAPQARPGATDLFTKARPAQSAEGAGAGTDFVEERKVVTVLFADTKGSLSIIAGQDPETARTILDEVVEIARDAIHRYSGTVTRVQGDGIMALFGAPTAHEDHAIRACLAALAIQRSMLERASEIGLHHAVEIKMRVGLATGEVVVHSTRNDMSANYDATGEAVHLAARMEQLAPPGSIVMADSTYKVAAGEIESRSLGMMPVKGLREPLEIYDVMRARAGWREFSRSWGHRMAPFVDRRQEHAIGLEHMAQAAAGNGQVLIVSGEPGCGKSRLVRE